MEWINQNDSLSVGFDLTPFDTGLNPENCSSLVKVSSYNFFEVGIFTKVMSFIFIVIHYSLFMVTFQFISYSIFSIKDLPPNTDLIIGAARSACTAALYKKIDRLGIPMITYASTSTVLARKTMYPNLFRVCPSDSCQAMAIAELVEQYNWDKIGIVAANDMYGKELASDVKNLLQKRAIDVTAMQFFESGASGMTQEVFKVNM